MGSGQAGNKRGFLIVLVEPWDPTTRVFPLPKFKFDSGHHDASHSPAGLRVYSGSLAFPSFEFQTSDSQFCSSSKFSG